MSELKKETETKHIIIFETDFHILKVAEEKLNKFDDSPKSLRKLRTMIQKSMRQKVETCKGEDWQRSFELIFMDITGGQTTLWENQ